MNIAIRTTSPWYAGDDTRMACYRAAGLMFEPVDEIRKPGWWQLTQPCTRDVATLEELLAWVATLNQEVILSADGSLEIYDDYRE